MGFGELVKSGAQAALGLAPFKRSALRTYLNDKPKVLKLKYVPTLVFSPQILVRYLIDLPTVLLESPLRSNLVRRIVCISSITC